MNEDRLVIYWKKNVSLIIGCLIVWAIVGLGCGVILANPLYGIKIGGIPLSFWFAQQGSIITFVCLIFFYSWKMDKLDAEFNVEEVKLTDKKGVQG